MRASSPLRLLSPRNHVTLPRTDASKPAAESPQVISCSVSLLDILMVERLEVGNCSVWFVLVGSDTGLVAITQYLSNPKYYFQVNSQYVRNKLKVVLFPFLHRGHWTRITEPVEGRLSYKPPIQDINAPILYIPLMAFGTYVVIAGYALGVLGRFTPEALTLQFTRGLLGWFLQIILIRVLLYSLGITTFFFSLRFPILFWLGNISG